MKTAKRRVPPQNETGELDYGWLFVERDRQHLQLRAQSWAPRLGREATHEAQRQRAREQEARFEAWGLSHFSALGGAIKHLQASGEAFSLSLELINGERHPLPVPGPPQPPFVQPSRLHHDTWSAVLMLLSAPQAKAPPFSRESRNLAGQLRLHAEPTLLAALTLLGLGPLPPFIPSDPRLGPEGRP